MRRTFVGLVMLVRLWIALSVLRCGEQEGELTCCLDFVDSRFEHNATLDYL